MTKEEILLNTLDYPSLSDIDGEFPSREEGEWPSDKIGKAMEQYAKEMSNAAIDDAIKVVDEFSKTNSPFNDPYFLFHNLISRLKKLKK